MKVTSKNKRSEIIYHYDIEQNSDEWHQMRCGRIGGTSSNTLVVQGKKDGLGTGALTSLYTKVDELINGCSNTNEISDFARERGRILEPEAKKVYEEISGNIVHDVGYVSEGLLWGCSPDGLVGDDGGLEIKCPLGKEYVRYMATLEIDTKYYSQVQWCLYITGREWWDFIYYHPDYTKCNSVIRRITPDEKYFTIWDKNCKVYEQKVIEIIETYNKAKGFNLL